MGILFENRIVVLVWYILGTCLAVQRVDVFVSGVAVVTNSLSECLVDGILCSRFGGGAGVALTCR